MGILFSQGIVEKHWMICDISHYTTYSIQENVRKTLVHSDTRTPVFGEIFLFKHVTTSTLQTTQLEISVLDKKVISPKRQSLIGKVFIDLDTLETSSVETKRWYILVK